MLELKNISKKYEIGKKKDSSYQVVNALKEINIEFRKNEFVSVLGPSGCGKTTLLNIIGGLDKYSSGNLSINKKSTKKFKDADWDTYRNHSVGFVFQSYNLIPHQTILQNVELALTLSGISREERKKRAIKVLEKVGLKDRINTKPNQLSGGQMQRVAIARALINDPEIILADEPTGALDSKTSVQIMNLLKEISKDKLIIMVTHNPQLAEQYSTRIVKLLDGKIIDDSNPYSSEDCGADDKVLSISSDDELTKRELSKKKKKRRMSFFTALSLSLKNLMTKKARTFLVSFAGSIGIIGIALILAVSTGFNGYINKVQEDSLSSYPIMIKEQGFDITSMFANMFSSTEEKSNHQKDAVYTSEAITKLFNTVADAAKPNDIKSFYNYLQENFENIEENVNAIQYTYGIDFELYNNAGNKIYPKSGAMFDVILAYAVKYFEQLADVTITKIPDGYNLTANSTEENKVRVTQGYIYAYLGAEKQQEFITNGNSINLSENNLTSIIDGVVFGQLSSMGDYTINMFRDYDLGAINEMLDNQELISSQYDLVAGTWMNSANDLLLVLDENNEIDDYILYSFGLISYDQMCDSIVKTLTDNKSSITVPYSQIVGSDVSTNFKLMLASDYYNSKTNSIDRGDLRQSEYIQALKNAYTKDELNEYIQTQGRALKICGIIRANGKSSNSCLTPGLVYSSALSESLINEFNSSLAVSDLKMKAIDKNSPNSISIFVKNFNSKQNIKNFIEGYNNSREDQTKAINYNDNVDILMSSISTIVNAITYVLIAFVSISLVVSSIMIGIITYISVIERTKEIGVLRSIGASKRDVKRVFTAESLIVGFMAGAFGLLITFILCVPLTIIINSLANISITIGLSVFSVLVLLGISMFLTFIAGLIPAKIASKKDPVVALRTE